MNYFGEDRMPWLRTYAAICAGILALVIVALVLLVSFADLGLSANGIAALFTGAVLTIALTMVLMGLLFISDRSGHDASAQGNIEEDSHGGSPSS